MKYFLNLLLLLVLLVPCEAQHLKLSLNLKKGSTYYMTGNSNSEILQTINGQENKVNVGLVYRIAFKVTDVIDSGYSMEVRYQMLKMKIKAANNTVEMDSKKNDKTDIPSTVIAAMMNKPFMIVISKSGKIRSIKNVEKMISSAFDDFPQVDAAKKEQIKNQLLQSFGGNAFKGNLEMETAVFPEVQVAKNDKWSVDTKLQSTFKMNVHTVYQLTGIGADGYHIHGNGTLVTDKNSKPGQINGLPMKYNITGTSTTDVKTDKITGWVSEVKLKQVMKGNIEILDNPKVLGGMNIPMVYNADVITTDK
jgi:hypoxanthine phosphoribosyltransferase